MGFSALQSFFVAVMPDIRITRITLLIMDFPMMSGGRRIANPSSGLEWQLQSLVDEQT